MRAHRISSRKVAAVAALLGSLAGCSLPRAMVTPRLGTFDVKGDIAVSSSGASASNSVDSVGLVEDDSVFGGRVDLAWGGIELSASAQTSTHDGDGVLEADVSQGGTTISAGTSVASALDLGLYNALLTFDLVPGDTFELGIGPGISVIDIQASFTDTTTSDQVSTDEVVPVPLLVLRAGAQLGPVHVSALVGGMKVSIDGNDATYLDVDLMGRLRLLGDGDHMTGWLTVGWREVDIDVQYDDGGDSVDADLTFSGPYFGVTIGF